MAETTAVDSDAWMCRLFSTVLHGSPARFNVAAVPCVGGWAYNPWKVEDHVEPFHRAQSRPAHGRPTPRSVRSVRIPVAHCPPPQSLAFLIGVVAGLRSMTPPAAVRWAARLGWLYSESTPLAGRGRRSYRPGRAGRAAAGDATGLPRLTLVFGLWQCDKQNRESRSRPMVLGPNRGRSGATRGC